MSCKTRINNETVYGLWWAMDYWLVRQRQSYDDVQEQFKVFSDLFGENQDVWEENSIQLRRVWKRFCVGVSA